MKCQCFGCEARRSACWSKCTHYLAYREEIKRKKEEAHRLYIINDYEKENAWKRE